MTSDFSWTIVRYLDADTALCSDGQTRSLYGERWLTEDEWRTTTVNSLHPRVISWLTDTTAMCSDGQTRHVYPCGRLMTRTEYDADVSMQNAHLDREFPLHAGNSADAISATWDARRREAEAWPASHIYCER